MKKISILILVILFCNKSNAQSYNDELLIYREVYKNSFLTDPRSPLKKDDLQFIDFYAANPKFNVLATFIKLADDSGFEMQTHSGKIKRYFKFGKINFTIKNKKFSLFVYKQKKEILNAEEDYIFIPFTDNTNYKTTYGGGRYLDFKLKDIVNNTLQLDFNKCYNPFCMYKSGYSCPIPPAENSLNIKIEAGEKLYLKASN